MHFVLTQMLLKSTFLVTESIKNSLQWYDKAKLSAFSKVADNSESLKSINWDWVDYSYRNPPHRHQFRICWTKHIKSWYWLYECKFTKIEPNLLINYVFKFYQTESRNWIIDPQMLSLPDSRYPNKNWLVNSEIQEN